MTERNGHWYDVMKLYEKTKGPAIGWYLATGTWSVWSGDYVCIAEQMIAMDNGWA